jgi:hypothetical protein
MGDLYCGPSGGEINSSEKVFAMYWVHWIEFALHLGLAICALLLAMGMAG